MTDSEETRRDKRPNTEMDFSPFQRMVSIPNHHYNNTETGWAQVMYSSLNKRFEELELSIDHSLDYAHDTATQAFASTGVNSVSIIKLKEHCTDLECRLKMAEQKNKTLEECVIYQYQ